jgi:hypothetical protein
LDRVTAMWAWKNGFADVGDSLEFMRPSRLVSCRVRR